MSTIVECEDPNLYTPEIEAFLATTKNNNTSIDDVAQATASHLISTMTDSANPDDDVWQFWYCFLYPAAASFSSHAALRSLFKAIKTHPPTTPTNLKAGTLSSDLSGKAEDGRIHWDELPWYEMVWSDYLSGVEDRPLMWKEYLHLTTFLASLLKEGLETDMGAVIRVLYSCKQVLEIHGPRKAAFGIGDIRPLWNTDVQVTATWLRDGGSALWNADITGFNSPYHPTELWPRSDGIPCERWQLWRDRLYALAYNTEDCHGEEGKLLSKETKAVIIEAIAVIDGLLAGDKDKAKEALRTAGAVGGD